MITSGALNSAGSAGMQPPKLLHQNALNCEYTRCEVLLLTYVFHDPP